MHALAATRLPYQLHCWPPLVHLFGAHTKGLNLSIGCLHQHACPGAGDTQCVMGALQGDLSRKEWVAPALSPLTEGAGDPRSTGNVGAGIQQTLHNAVETTKDYLPAQVTVAGASGTCTCCLKCWVLHVMAWSHITAVGKDRTICARGLIDCVQFAVPWSAAIL